MVTYAELFQLCKYGTRTYFLPLTYRLLWTCIGLFQLLRHSLHGNYIFMSQDVFQDIKHYNIKSYCMQFSVSPSLLCPSPWHRETKLGTYMIDRLVAKQSYLKLCSLYWQNSLYSSAAVLGNSNDVMLHLFLQDYKLTGSYCLQQFILCSVFVSGCRIFYVSCFTCWLRRTTCALWLLLGLHWILNVMFVNVLTFRYSGLLSSISQPFKCCVLIIFFFDLL